MLKTETLRTALEEGATAHFDYDGKPRVVEVHAIGTSTKDGSAIMRGFQVAGEAGRPLPIWGLYTIDKMEALTLSMLPLSEAPREGYKMHDKQMATIIAQIELEVTDAVA